MKYVSTRGNCQAVTAAQAIAKGMVSGGGLFVPESFPAVDFTWQELAEMSYGQVAQKILGLYLTDYSAEEIARMVQDSYYEGNFDHAQIAPLVKVQDAEILELWHGPTAAFKDMALQLMPHLLVAAIDKIGEEKEIIILVATSGDTGKAALEGFKNVPGVKIIVFYPKGGVSNTQEMQMLTTDGNNTYVVGVDGNFDTCQTAVKEIFADQKMAALLNQHQMAFSSANSINWGRLLPQIVYYFYSYGQMLANKKISSGEKINFVVPTGNFGNILAAYYGYRMGLPVNKFICASNINNVLTDVIQSGTYDRRRPFHQTTSPSMDILVSSNFERFLFEMWDRDGAAVNTALTQLSDRGFFTVPPKVKEKWQEILVGGYGEEAEVAQTIATTFQDSHYLLDPHTAVAMTVYRNYQKTTGDQHQTIVVSTASPYKFGQAVLNALGYQQSLEGEELLAKLAQVSACPIHPRLIGVSQKPVLHHRNIDAEHIVDAVLDILHLN